MDSLTLSRWFGDFGTLLLTVVCALAVVRRSWRNLPWFTAYLFLALGADVLRWSVLHHSGFGSAAYSWTYWATQTVLVIARGAALADVCRAALGAYTGVWQFARILLGVTAVGLLSAAGVRTASSTYIRSYVLFVERELEFTMVVTLLVLLLFCRYYDVALERPLDGISMGFVFYSSVVIISSSIRNGPLAPPWLLVSTVRTGAYAVATAFWAFALRTPLPAPVRQQLSTVESYERNARVVSDRMRELNARLLALTRR